MVIMFVLLSGASPSVVRAGLMAIILIFSEILAREPDIYSSIATSAFLILLYNPFTICDVGFILSFGGTIGIVLLNTKINAKITNFFKQKFEIILKNKIFQSILDMLSVTLSAQIILLPVMWYYFNTISFVSILTNLLVGPFTGVITILGLALYIIGLICFPLAKLLSYSVYILLSIVISISKLCAKVPYGNVLVPTPSMLFIITYYLIIWEIFRNKENLKYNVTKNIISLLIIVQVLIFIIPKNYVEICMIDVGQGDSFLIKDNHNYTLIDGGGSENSSYDVGEKVLVPYLLDHTDGVIDAMFISHFHEDHAEGCISVLEKLKVNKVIIGMQPKKTELYDKLLKIVKEKNIQLITLVAGNTIKIGNVTYDILFPTKEIESLDNLNNSSLVMKVTANDKTILFTGDMEKEIEKIVLEQNIDKIANIDILKAGHHGSKTSSSLEFLEVIKPKITLISVGRDNKFGHPNDEIIERIEKMGSRIYRTDISGEIALKIYKNNKIKLLNINL